MPIGICSGRMLAIFTWLAVALSITSAVSNLGRPENTTGIVLCFGEVFEGVSLSQRCLTGHLPIQKQRLEKLIWVCLHSWVVRQAQWMSSALWPFLVSSNTCHCASACLNRWHPIRYPFWREKESEVRMAVLLLPSPKIWSFPNISANLLTWLKMSVNSYRTAGLMPKQMQKKANAED